MVEHLEETLEDDSGGLADQVDLPLLRAAFIPFGDIVSINMPMDYQTGRCQICMTHAPTELLEKHRGFAFIEFEEMEDAMSAIDNMNKSPHIPTPNLEDQETVSVRPPIIDNPGRRLCECRGNTPQYSSVARRGVVKARTSRLAIEKLVDPEVKRTYRNQLPEYLPDGTVSDINGHWEKISKALIKAGTPVCGTTQPTSSKHCISDTVVSLLKTRRQLPPGRHHNST
ncbi:peptidyl-prolyl isomerase E (cyclophilin E) [Clonorchis sinensis]|uniref:Peptidyl-prolyl isomerase E (Cyclophilin E) n=1 Tax=Clonorchis sinensis TaxID=79923 RepID=G7Y7Y9_CLOSI|nr:peptidyl-prolyl isomerase E (cyclophilin E) [Clonorchis sinensis]